MWMCSSNREDPLQRPLEGPVYPARGEKGGLSIPKKENMQAVTKGCLLEDRGAHYPLT